MTTEMLHYSNPTLDEPLKHFVSLLPKGAAVLDAGCSTSGQTEKFLTQGFSAVGIDISPEMIKIAKKVVPGTDFRVMDVTALDFPNESFDAIWCSRTLVHLPDSELQSAFQNFHRILKPDGLLCLIVYEGQGSGIEKDLDNPEGENYEFIKYFQKDELQKLLADNGFTTNDISEIKDAANPRTHLVAFAHKSA